MEPDFRPFCSGFKASVPGTRNSANPCGARLVPGVPGVPGLRARIRDTHARTLRARLRTTLTLFSRVHTRYTRNTRNNPCVARIPAVPGTRNRTCEPGTAMAGQIRLREMTRDVQFASVRDADGRSERGRFAGQETRAFYRASARTSAKSAYPGIFPPSHKGCKE